MLWTRNSSGTSAKELIFIILVTFTGGKVNAEVPEQAGQSVYPNSKESIEGRVVRNVFDFGTHEVGEIVFTSIPVVPTSEFAAPFHIARTSCGCTEATLDVDPSGATALEIKIRVEKFGPKEVTVLVRSGTSTETRVYAFRVHGKDGMAVYPRKGYFTVVTGREEYPVRVVYRTVDLSAVAGFDKMESDAPGLRCGQIVSVRREREGWAEFTFQILLLHDRVSEHSVVSKGITFRLATSNGARSIVFPLILETGSVEYQLVPKKCFFMCQRSAPEGEFPTRTVKIQYARSEEILSLAYSNCGSLPLKVEITRKSSQEFMLNATVVASKLNELLDRRIVGDIIVDVMKPNRIEKLAIPVVLLVRE